jgi:hypothetical protein
MVEQTKSGVVADGRTIFGPNKRFGPGETYSGPASEVARLRKLGFLVDPAVRLVEHPDVPGGGCMLIYNV